MKRRKGVRVAARTEAKEIGDRHYLNMSGFSTVDGPEGEERVFFFGDDKRGWNLRTELRRTIADLMRGDEPSTVLGVLIRQIQDAEGDKEKEAIDIEALAEAAGRTVTATEGIVDYLAEEELAVSLVEDGTEKVIGTALYTPKNGEELPSADEQIATRTP